MWIQIPSNKFSVHSFPQIYASIFFCLLFLSLTVNGYTQSNLKDLERRVQALENYVETFQPTLLEFSDNMNSSIQNYSSGLESSLSNYTERLKIQMDDRLNSLEANTVVIDVKSQSFQKLNTNTGTFLIAIERIEKIDKGYRLHLNIGNPNFADYKDFKLKFFWGVPWNSMSLMGFDAWRQSLIGAEYSFKAKIEKGKWNRFEVDIVPASKNDLGYVECEMEISSVEMNFQ